MLEMLFEMHARYPRIGFSISMVDPGDVEGLRPMIVFICDGEEICDPTMGSGMTESVDPKVEYGIEAHDARRIAMINHM